MIKFRLSHVVLKFIVWRVQVQSCLMTTNRKERFVSLNQITNLVYAMINKNELAATFPQILMITSVKSCFDH